MECTNTQQWRKHSYNTQTDENFNIKALGISEAQWSKDLENTYKLNGYFLIYSTMQDGI